VKSIKNSFEAVGRAWVFKSIHAKGNMDHHKVLLKRRYLVGEAASTMQGNCRSNYIVMS
jgi:hypothetical protein